MKCIRGEISVPGDKSISHRAVMLGSIAKGATNIKGFLAGADCLSTIGCFKAMGIDIERNDDEVRVHGRGLYGLKEPSAPLDCGNSGTTLRLISGILSAQNFSSVITGDASIRKRPMKRITEPLNAMGADIRSIEENGCAPLSIRGSRLHGIDYISPVASAQVKSSVLLAGLYADSPASVSEPALSRNHTELMLKQFGADIISEGNKATVFPANEIYAADIEVPGDISSAAFFIAAASVCPGSELIIRNAGINPTRDGIIRAAKEMGASIEIINPSSGHGEAAADILVKYSALHGIELSGDIIPAIIDEIPVLAAMAAVAEGETVIRDASELKVKESNRIRVMCEELTKLGADIIETGDGMIIRGGRKLHSASVNSHGDHRIAMTFAVLSLITDLPLEISDRSCVDISYPGFYRDLERVTVNK